MPECLEKSPRNRYATGFELARDLQKFRCGLPVAARPVTRLDRSVRWIGRNPRFAAVSALLLLAYQANYLVLEDTVRGYLVGAYSRNLQQEEAREHLEASLNIADQLWKLEPRSVAAIDAMARSRSNMGSWLAQHQVDLERAKNLFEESREYVLMRKEVSENPLEVNRRFALTSTNLAKVIKQLDGDLNESLDYANEAVELLDDLAKDYPKKSQIRF